MSGVYPGSVYPWQAAQWEQIQRRATNNNLAHALLLTGAAGIGKYDFAVALAQGLLCSEPDSTGPDRRGQACGQCKSCQLFAAENHPDFTLIAPAEDATAIRIDQIRELITYLGLHSHFNGRRIVILSPAENMNTAAANSLLKTLEEPQPDTLLLLISANPARLPATIRSRCQLVRFGQPAPEQAKKWLSEQLDEPSQTESLLELASGAPLLALSMGNDDTLPRQQQLLDELSAVAEGQKDPMALAAEWAKDDSGRPVLWLHTWASDMIRSHTGIDGFAHNRNLAPTLHSLAKRIDLQRLYAFLDKVSEAVRLQQTSANKRLLLEGVLIAWASL